MNNPPRVTKDPMAGLPQGRPPALVKKEKYKVGFAQSESTNPWRKAQSESMLSEAKKRGHELLLTDAAGSEAQQLADVESMIAAHVDLIFLAPCTGKLPAQAVLKAKAAGIPVILFDRTVDPTLVVPGQDYVSFIGSNDINEGKLAAEWLIKATNGKAKILQLEGTSGAQKAIDRKTGFEASLKKAPDMQIVDSKNGDFSREKGRQAMEGLIRANSDATAIFAHSDEMALGAIAAVEGAGKKPGTDILIVSIDGEKEALAAIIAGKLGASVECTPRFGPKAFEFLDMYASGNGYPFKVTLPDRLFDSENAATEQH